MKKVNELFMSHQDNLVGFFENNQHAAYLPDYYETIYHKITEEHSQVVKEVVQLKEKVCLIFEIIHNLQEQTRSGSQMKFEEDTDIATIIDMALEIENSYVTKSQVRVIKDYAKLGRYPIQRSKLTHVLVNIIKNSIEAMRETPLEDRILTVGLYMDPKENPVIRIADKGSGIEPGNIQRLFSWGFTTKNDGHGFGLHTCANYMKEMGGDISVSSEGLGRGAVFTLTLPKNQREEEKKSNNEGK
jgi:signal transduction histidine kinase